MKEAQGCIYELRCVIGRKKGYVGQDKSGIPETHRWLAHARAAQYPKPKYPIHRAIRKYGWENFSKQVVWHGPASKLNEMEVYYIKKLKTFAPLGYNMTTGGDAKKQISLRSRKKCSKSVTAAYAANPALRQNRIDTHTGIRLTLAARKSLSLVHLASYAKSDSRRKKMSANRTKYWNAPCEDGLTNAEALSMQCLGVRICRACGVPE